IVRRPVIWLSAGGRSWNPSQVAARAVGLRKGNTSLGGDPTEISNSSIGQRQDFSFFDIARRSNFPDVLGVIVAALRKIEFVEYAAAGLNPVRLRPDLSSIDERFR